MEACPGLFLFLNNVGRLASLSALSCPLTHSETNWSTWRYLLRFGYCASARPRVMLHERGLNDSHAFQETRVSISACVRPDIHTHWYEHPHQSRLQVSGKCDRVSARSNLCCVFVWDLAQSLYPSPSLPPPHLALSLNAFVPFHWRGSEAEGSLMRLFDRGMCSVKPRYMCALHVPGESAALLIHILCKTHSVRRGGMERMEVGAHGQKAELTVTPAPLTCSVADDGPHRWLASFAKDVAPEDTHRMQHKRLKNRKFPEDGTFLFHVFQHSSCVCYSKPRSSQT